MADHGTIEQMNQELLDFINESPTAFHVTAKVKEYLDEYGFQEFKEDSLWAVKPGTRGYVQRNGSSILAFYVPENRKPGFHMICAHSDSPCFKIKENAENVVEDQYLRLNVEKYGGMIVDSWFDRPLSAAGRIVFEEKGELVEQLVDLKQDLFIIPHLAIHMTRGGKEMQTTIQTDMQPLAAMGTDKESFRKLICKNAGISEESLLGTDLFLYNRQPGCVLGMNGEFISAPRIDDIACVYAGLTGLLNACGYMEEHKREESRIQILGVFDNEEVGSLTRQGADSDFLGCTLQNIAEGLGWTAGDYRRELSQSFMVSADNAHAVHPNHTEKADPTNRPYLNKGIVIKYHGAQKYTTDAVTGAYVKKICKDQDVPFQTYHNHSDIAGGSTLGNIALGKVSVPAADIGMAQLAMHSAFETAGSEDLSYMVRFMKSFYID